LDVTNKILKTFDSIANYAKVSVESFASDWMAFWTLLHPEKQFKLVVLHEDAPQQHNHIDCGAYACFFLSLAHQFLGNTEPKDPALVIPGLKKDFTKAKMELHSRFLRMWLAGAIVDGGCLVAVGKNLAIRHGIKTHRNE
jgi:Ulp1 family protease